MIQNEQTKLSLYQASAEAEERLLEQQKLETTKKLIKSTNYGIPVQPVEF